MSQLPSISTLFPYTTLFRSLNKRSVINPLSNTTNNNNSTFQRAQPQQRLTRSEIKHNLDLQTMQFEMDMLKKKQELDEFKEMLDRKSTRLNSSHANISYAVF